MRIIIIVIIFIINIYCLNIKAIGLSIFKGAEEIKNEIKALNNDNKEIKDALKNINNQMNDLKILSDIKAGVNDNTIKNKVNELQNSIQNINEKINLRLALIDKLESLLKLENNIEKIQTDITGIKDLSMKIDVENRMQNNLLNNLKVDLQNEMSFINKSMKMNAGRDVSNISNDSKLIKFIIGAILSNFLFIIIFLIKDNIRLRKEFQKYIENKDLEMLYYKEIIERISKSKDFYKSKLLSKLSYEDGQAILKEKKEKEL